MIDITIHVLLYNDGLLRGLAQAKVGRQIRPRGPRYSGEKGDIAGELDGRDYRPWEGWRCG